MKKCDFSLDKHTFSSYNLFRAVKSATIEYIRGAVRISFRTRKICKRLRWDLSRTLLTCSDNTGVGRYFTTQYHC